MDEVELAIAQKWLQCAREHLLEGCLALENAVLDGAVEQRVFRQVSAELRDAESFLQSLEAQLGHAMDDATGVEAAKRSILALVSERSTDPTT